MKLIAAVVLPVAAVTWLATGVALLALKDSPERHAWLAQNRWWFLWPALALYLGLALTWIAVPITLLAGFVAYGLDRRRTRAIRP